MFVEAKAHIAELASPPSKATVASLEFIKRALVEVRESLAPGSEADWSCTFYQYANRFAHLYLLRHSNQLPAHLIFLYFINAQDVDGPSSVSEWEAAVKLVHAALELRPNTLEPFTYNLHVDVTALDDVDC